MQKSALNNFKFYLSLEWAKLIYQKQSDRFRQFLNDLQNFKIFHIFTVIVS